MTLKLETLKDELARDKTFADITDRISERHRGRHRITVSRLQRIYQLENQNVDRQDIVASLRKFEAAGAGTIVYNSSKQATHIDWEYNPVTVACAILGKPDPFKKPKTDETPDVNEVIIRAAPKRPRRSLPRVPTIMPELPKAEPKVLEAPKPELPKVEPKVLEAPKPIEPPKAEPKRPAFEDFATALYKPEVVVIRHGGTELEVDMRGLTAESCKKLSDILTSLKSK